MVEGRERRDEGGEEMEEEGEMAEPELMVRGDMAQI
jgi:hypothetical protein